MFDFGRFITDTYSIALTAAMLVAMIYLCVYYGLIHFRVGRYHRKHAQKAALPEHLPAVSVVLTAHNDEEWLKENLVYLLEQDYPNFEVVVVDYKSDDGTPYVLKTLHDYYPHLKIVPFLQDVNLFQGKKYPLSIGIKSARNDILLLADPDCAPKNLQWLRGMVKGYYQGANPHETQVVLGFCGVKRTKSLLSLLQQYDNLCYSSHYLGCALLGHPYTGSGRNLSYRRSFFFKQGAFISHYDVAEGSDDLFVYKNSNKSNTRICIDDDACLQAEPRPKFRQWHDDRLRRVATRKRHNARSRITEQLLPLCNLVFYAAAVILLLIGNLPWVVVAAVVVAKWAWQIVSFSRLTRRFNGGWIYLIAPLLEIYFIVANTILILHPLRSNRIFANE